MYCVYESVFLKELDVWFSDCIVCMRVCTYVVFFKETKTCQGEKLASAVGDTLDEYLIALQHKNR